MLGYMRETIHLPLLVGMDGSNEIQWWVHASFGTRYGMQSQTRGTMSLGYGSLYSVSRKQKLNTTTSTEAELVGVHEVMSQIVWMRYFMLAQGIKISRNTLYQDSQSVILLKKKWD
jgi:hypothetical protein